MAERISRALLPDNTSVADDGMATFGGVRVDDLVTQFGTPLFVYDEDHIRRRCQEAVKAFPDGVSYASKAFLCKAIAKLVHDCLLYTSPSPRDLSTSRMPSSA